MHRAPAPCPSWAAEALARQSAALYPAALGLTRNVADAEDLVQETLTRALGAAGQLRSDQNLRSWLRRIMINTYISGYRKRHREPGGKIVESWPPRQAFGDVPDRAGSAEDQALARAISPEIAAAMRSLPDSHRLLVYLADVAGLSYLQIAEIAGIPAGSVKSRLHRGRAGLRAQLGGSTRSAA